MKIGPLVRTALLVEDLSRSRRFYEALLGWREVYYEGEIEGPSVAHLLGGPPDLHVRAVILKAPGPAAGMVGLFELAAPRLERPDGPLRIGESVLVFYCSDLDVAIERALAHGGSVYAAPVPLVVAGRSKQRETTLRDPDGFAINLIEWDPDAARRPEHDPGT